MTKKKKAVLAFVGVVLSVALLWSDAMTLRFMSRLFLPENWGAFTWLPGIAAVIVFDWGAIAWALLYIHGEGSTRRLLSAAMVVLMFFCSATLTVGEIWLGGQALAVVPDWFGNVALTVLSGGVIVTIAGGLAFVMSDPESIKAEKLQDARDEIQNETMSATLAAAKDLALKVAPQLAQVEIDRIKAELGIVDRAPAAPMFAHVEQDLFVLSEKPNPTQPGK